MKKVLLLAICLSFMIAAVNAQQMQPDHAKKPLESPVQGRPINLNRSAPDYQFTRNPTVLLESYYDYMIGSYGGIPIRNIPLDEGGYFLSFHGKRTPGGSRRTFYAHLSADGNVSNINEISQVTNHEGYPALGVDPVSGKPLYAWHANVDADAELEVQFTSDAFMFGLSGLFNEIQTIMDGPMDVLIDGVVASSNNAFIWPTIQIGPSPVAGMRRAYVSARNNVSHTISTDPSENVLIAYADFNGPMIEGGVDLEWSYTSIPELDEWNHAQGDFRRPNFSLITDDLGNVYYIGYHIFRAAGDAKLTEPEMDVFVCPNYGEGTWTRVSDYDRVPTWNPNGQPDGTGYFVGDDGPYPDEDLYWGIINSAHSNAVATGNGKIIFPAFFAVMSTASTYYPDFHTVKAMIYDPATQQFSRREIYPQQNPEDDYNQVYTPWDTQAPWGEAEYSEASDGQFYLDKETIWPFPHWDSALHGDSMMFHCGYLRLSEPNEDGMMVAVWQDALRSQLYNKYPDSYPELAEFSDTPEVYIAVSRDSGMHWSEPIVLNKVDTPEFAGLKPMWVYPADKVISTGVSPEGVPYGKIGLMFYDDYTWGAHAVDPPAHSVNDGGAVMFAELQINFGTSNEDGTAPQITKVLNQNYPNPFNPETTISFDMPANGTAKLDIYNVKGQLVKSLFDGVASSGRTSLVWDSTDNGGQAVTSGIYFYRLSTANHRETRKMMLMK
ncbi:MAG: T9SS type A sorting domain-containing protein [Candidatus Cloacimonetes bacterium]|nr:T9SS type A sorting domain-containing protein [Candidatus Cloacimonadota bacterium]MDY0171992.1 T9SS type A sorting domain-containing protein [Candidatus Cloacimonadaceae bacterium]